MSSSSEQQSRTEFQPSDIGSVVEFVVASWGVRGTVWWNGPGGTYVGRIALVQRRPRSEWTIEAAPRVGSEVIEVTLSGVPGKITFPAAALESVQRFEVAS